METLQLKHICGYLPYGLKIKNKFGEIGILSEITSLGETTVYETVHSYAHLGEIKLLLRPLSSLTKEIEHNGERFVPILELAKVSDDYYKWEIDESSLFHKSAFCYIDQRRYSFSVNTDFKNIYSFNTSLNGGFIQTNNPHLVYEKLFELHLDVFGLIDKNLAINLEEI